jgi:hypothetical protein
MVIIHLIRLIMVDMAIEEDTVVIMVDIEAGMEVVLVVVITVAVVGIDKF